MGLLPRGSHWSFGDYRCCAGDVPALPGLRRSSFAQEATDYGKHAVLIDASVASPEMPTRRFVAACRGSRVSRYPADSPA